MIYIKKKKHPNGCSFYNNIPKWLTLVLFIFLSCMLVLHLHFPTVDDVKTIGQPLECSYLSLYQYTA